MKKNIALVFYYRKENKTSFHVLAGSLETEEYFDNLHVYFLEKEESFIKDINNILDLHEKVIICFSFFSTQVQDIKILIKNLKELYGNRPLYIAGGPHATGDPRGTLNLGLDIAVIGEGEETLGELLIKIDNGEEWKNIKGIAYLNNKKEYCRTPHREAVDLNKYPPFTVRHGRCNSIELTRGCPFMCYFCQTPFIFGTKPRHRSVETICKYVQLMKEHKFTDVRFITPSAFSYGSDDGRKTNLPELEHLLKSLKKITGDSGRIFLGSFPSEVRPEQVTKEALNLILKYADNKQVVIGAQTGSRRILELCHRGNTIADIYHSTELILEAGLKPIVDFIFGLPGEREEDILLTIEMIEKLSKKGARIRAHTFMPLPQTPFAKSPPADTDENIQKVINDLLHRGLLFGKWEKQKEYSIKIVNNH
jgi:B12-binding domain/radical SAM domain protein